MEEIQKIIPFKFHSDRNHGQANANTKHRWFVYRKFMGDAYGCWDFVLDVGEYGYVADQLGNCVSTDETDFNYQVTYLDVRGSKVQFDAITCFEVINHVMNPLQFMEQIRDLLKDNGVCYLSCPKVGWLNFYHCKYNFVNYRPEKLKILFEYAGFRPVRCEIHNPWPFWFALTGIRPFFRWLFNRIQVWELRKA